jgi:hypothetical protein
MLWMEEPSLSIMWLQRMIDWNIWSGKVPSQALSSWQYFAVFELNSCWFPFYSLSRQNPELFGKMTARKQSTAPTPTPTALPQTSVRSITRRPIKCVFRRQDVLLKRLLPRRPVERKLSPFVVFVDTGEDFIPHPTPPYIPI